MLRLQILGPACILLRPGDGLSRGEGQPPKCRTRGGAKAQAVKRKAELEQEQLAEKKHQRTMMDRLATLAEKALDKM